MAGGLRSRWRKVWAEMWATPSLSHLDYHAIYAFVVLIVHAEWEPGDDSAEVFRNLSVSESRKAFKKISRMPPRRAERALADLAGAGSVVMREGTIIIPDFGKWQETADAARKRRARGQRDGLSAETPSPSPSTSTSDHERAAQIPTRQNPRAGTDIAILAQWRTYGGDTDGLGKWPTPKAPDGTVLPQLTIPTRLCEVLQSGRTAEQVHRTVHTLARMVEAGALPKGDHRGAYVFSGHYEGFEQRALEWEAAQARKAEEAAKAEASRPAELTPEEKAALEF